MTLRARMLSLIICAASSATGGAAFGAELIGAEKCGSCHQKELKDWQRTGHALAFARLSKVQQRDATCRSCHTMDPSSDDVELTGVQCESCHGAGRMYAPRYVMRDKDLSKLLGLMQVTEETCAPCHSKDTPSVKSWTFAEKLELVKHKDVNAKPKPDSGKSSTKKDSP